MKKIILAVVLLAAAGGALYLYFKPKLTDKPSAVSYAETIIGDWKIDSVAANDSGSIGLLLLTMDTNLTNYTFRFDADGAITQLLNDSILPQKGRYEWKDSSQLMIIEGDSATDKELMQVLSLSPEQFSVMSADSAVLYFKKKK